MMKAYLLAGSILFVFGLVGYVCFRSSTRGYIVDNFLNSDKEDSTLFLAITIVFYMSLVLPTSFINCRENTIAFFNGRFAHDSSLISSASVVLMLTLLTITLIVLVNDPVRDTGTGVGPTFTIIIRIIGCIIAFSGILPPLMHLSLFRREKYDFFRTDCLVMYFTLFLCFSIPFGFNVQE